MRILAFDQASRTSGYAVLDDGKLVAHGKFTFEDDDFGLRLLHIREKVDALIEQYNPNKVLFEDIQLQENVETYKKLAEVYGVVDELLTEKNMPHETIPSVTWKSTLGIKGKDRPAQKRNAANWVETTFSIKPTQDECDAICIGSYYFSNQKASVEAFDWS